jgi:hypothetical protein
MKKSYVLYDLSITFRNGALYKGDIDYINERFKTLVKLSNKVKKPYHYVIIDSETDRLIKEKQKSIF